MALKPLYKFIFDNSRWWWGKISASALIGGIAFGGGALKTQDEFVKAHALDFAVVGCLIGFVAAVVLMLNDFRQGIGIDATHPDAQSVLKSKRTLWPVVVGLIGVGLSIAVLYSVWLATK